MCLCVGYVRADVGSGGDQRCEIFWSWNCRLWRAALGGCRELNSRPLEEQQAHPLSPEPALPVVLFGFMIIESYPFWDPWLRGWDIWSQQPITVFPRDQQEVVGREKAAFLLELLSWDVRVGSCQQTVFPSIWRRPFGGKGSSFELGHIKGTLR